MSLIFGRRAWNLRAKSVPLFCLDGWINNLRCLFGFFVRMPGQKIGLTMLTTNFWSEVEDQNHHVFFELKCDQNLEVGFSRFRSLLFPTAPFLAPFRSHQLVEGYLIFPAFHLFFGVFRSHRGLSEGTEKNPRKFPPFWNAHGWGRLH